jgi:hypothetical protein
VLKKFPCLETELSLQSLQQLDTDLCPEQDESVCNFTRCLFKTNFNTKGERNARSIPLLVKEGDTEKYPQIFILKTGFEPATAEFTQPHRNYEKERRHSRCSKYTLPVILYKVKSIPVAGRGDP